MQAGREIKFRGMGVNGEWHYGYLSVVTDKRVGVPLGSYISNKAGSPFAYQVRPETVGQFTGLYDKNGKEIYEGDVVRLTWRDNSTDVGRIGYYENAFVWGSPSWRIYRLDQYELEVIGNIHENRELLEVGE